MSQLLEFLILSLVCSKHFLKGKKGCKITNKLNLITKYNSS